VIVDTGRAGHLAHVALALFLAPRVNHGEEGIGPVRVAGALVAVAHCGIASKLLTHGDYALGRHVPDHHSVGGKAGAPVEEDRGEAAHLAALDELPRVSE